jgi:integrase
MLASPPPPRSTPCGCNCLPIVASSRGDLWWPGIHRGSDPQDQYGRRYRNAATVRFGSPASPIKQSGSIRWLWDCYRESTAWTTLSSATRRQRENMMRGVIEHSGTATANVVNRTHIVAGRDRRAATPAQARHFLDVMRGLFRWALDAGHVKADPTLGVKNPAKPKSSGFPPWTEDDVARYEARWPIGSKERVWLGVLLYTALRRSDAVCLGRQHIRDRVATIRTKTNGVTVTIPILPVLDDIFRGGPCGELAFICGERGRPLTKESFGNLFRDACNAAGVKKSAHGVRMIGAIRAALNGATVAELDAIFGWQGGGMAALYVREADRARLAKSAMSKLDGTAGEQTLPSPKGKVRDLARKDKRYQTLGNQVVGEVGLEPTKA